MAAPTLANYEPLLNECYTGPKLFNLAAKSNPVLALMPKATDVGGDVWKVRVQGANGQGFSADLSQAITAGEATGPDSKAFLLNYLPLYYVAKVDNLTIESSASNKNAVIDAFQNAIEGKTVEFGKQLERIMFGDGFGAISTIGAIPGNVNIVTLPASDIEAIERVEIGQYHVFAQNAGTGNVRSSTALVVTAVDRDAGSITYNANLSTVSAAANDSIFIKGNRDEAASPARKEWTGFAGWLPGTAPSGGENFFSVDRSADPDRYAGIRITNPAGGTVRELLIDCAMRAGRRGATPSHLLMSWERFGQLQKECDAKMMVDIKAGADIVFRGIDLNLPAKGGGSVVALPVWACPGNRIYGLDMSTWRLGSVNGDLIRPTFAEGRRVLDYSNADAVQIRYRAYGNIACFAPGKNFVATIS